MKFHWRPNTQHTYIVVGRKKEENFKARYRTIEVQLFMGIEQVKTEATMDNMQVVFKTMKMFDSLILSNAVNIFPLR